MEGWSERDLRQLRRAAAKYPRDSTDRTDRWRKIGLELDRGKRECYETYRMLKDRRKKEGRGAVNRETKDEERYSPGEDEWRETDDFEDDAEHGIQMSSEKSDQIVFADLDDEDNLDVVGVVSSRSNISFQSNSDLKDTLEPSKAPSERWTSRRISLDEVKGIKGLLFGTRKVAALDESWRKQGFFFSKVRDIQYGLVQLKGGPCGVLAVVQAYILRNLVFGNGSNTSSINWENPSSAEQRSALEEALVEVIWQARSSRSARLCVQQDVDSKGGAFEKMMIFETESKTTLKRLVGENLSTFMQRTGPGVTMLLCSVILTREFEAIKGDVDTALGNEVTLIGHHSYAAQELVNLMLVGYASSNVFDGMRKLGGDETKGKDEEETILLHGIKKQARVGFLTLYEHYGYMQVGECLKHPTSPVFVVCSESHYSVLFSDGTLCESETFDLLYYDQLGNQDEPYRLTIDPAPYHPVEKDTSDQKLVPPIEQCIRTKWEGATVDWNGSEALL